MQTNLSSLDLLFSRHALAGLVADRAARLACRLAGASALTAARHFLRLRFCNRTDHIISPVIFFSLLYNGTTNFASDFFHFMNFLIKNA